MVNEFCVVIPEMGVSNCDGMQQASSNPYGIVGSPVGAFGNGGIGPGGYGPKNNMAKLPWYLWAIMGGILFVTYKVLK